MNRRPNLPVAGRLFPRARGESGVRGGPRLALLVLPALLAACAAAPTLQPGEREPATLGIPARLTATAMPAPGSVTPLDWQAFVQDADLRSLVERALAHNQDLRVAMLNVQRAQAQLDAAGAARWPSLGVGLNVQRAPNYLGQESSSATVGLQVPTWEIDFFGRLKALDDSARAQLLASEAGRRAAELALVAQVLQAAIALRTDAEVLALADRTLAARTETLRLVTLSEQRGAVSRIDLQTQAMLAAQAQAAAAQARRQRVQDADALQLLVGEPVDADAVAPQPAAPREAKATAASATRTTLLEASTPLADVPVGADSALLLQRPDVIQAEQTLLAARADVTAARRAFWPAITLTGQAGQASTTLADLVRTGGSFAYTVVANAALTIFDAGRRQANLDNAGASEQIALAQYRRAVQGAFRDTADALAATTTWRDQRDALLQQRTSAREVARLTDLKAGVGAASLLEQLDAQRTLFAAEQAALQAWQAEQTSRILLWKSLGR